MIELRYKLTENNILKYYEMILSASEKTKTPRLMSIIWGPTIILAVLIILRLIKIWSWWFLVAAILLAAVWMLFGAPAVFYQVCRIAAKRELQKVGFHENEIYFQESEGNFTVNGMKKNLKDYVTYQDLLILAFDDQTNLIVPDRAFQENVSLIKQFVTDILTALK